MKLHHWKHQRHRNSIGEEPASQDTLAPESARQRGIDGNPQRCGEGPHHKEIADADHAEPFDDDDLNRHDCMSRARVRYRGRYFYFDEIRIA